MTHDARMSVPVFDAVAHWFVAEGVDTHFTLLGDGNMHFATALAARSGVRTVAARHEHCAVAMALGYHSATGRVGMASVTCGPGFTQIMTALATASRSNVPMVVFAGETPLRSRWDAQAIEQRPLAEACGAYYIAAHLSSRVADQVREAFHVARTQGRPVVLGIPYDVQQELVPLDEYRTSWEALPPPTRVLPDPQAITMVATRLVEARRPMIVAGRGALIAGAEAVLRRLADRSGAVLATTIPARGLFDDHPFSVGIVGGWASPTGRRVAHEADLVVVFGASLSAHTLDGGSLFAGATTIQIDTMPQGLHHGRVVADHFVRADALLAAEAIEEAIEGRVPAATVRTPALEAELRCVKSDVPRWDAEPGTVDPRAVMATLDRLLPKDWDLVSGTGHSSYFHTTMQGRRPEHYHFVRGFGAIGNGLSIAIGVAVARGDGRTVLFDGDGGVIMHAQEFETIARLGLKLLICVLNDGAYGSEVHKLRAAGLDPSPAQLGRPDFAAIAAGFGLRGATVTDVGQLGHLFREYQHHDVAQVWDIHISPNVLDPAMARRVRVLEESRQA